MTICRDCSRREAKNLIYQLKSGKEVWCSELYVFPSIDAKQVSDEFLERIKSKAYGVIEVVGVVGAGKSTYLQYMKSKVEKHNLFLSEVMITESREFGRSGYMPVVMVEGLRVPTGVGWESFVEKVNKDKKFKALLSKTVSENERELSYESRPLAIAFEALASENRDLNEAATSWLKGIPPPTGAQREKDLLRKLRELGMPTSHSSIRKCLVDKVLFFLRTLAIRLGYSGFIVIVDEIEQAMHLSRSAGRVFLDGLRDLINILMEPPGTTIANQQGLFVAFAISTEYLAYSGVVDSTAEIMEKGVRSQKPKTTLADSPRLFTVLESMAQQVNAEPEERGIYLKIGAKIDACYARAYGKKPKGNAFVEKVLNDLEQSRSGMRTRHFVTYLAKRLARAK